MSDLVPVIDGQIVLDLDHLAVAIREQHEACEAAMSATVQHAIRAGELLAEAKAQVAHGEWLPWLSENFDGSRTVAWTYMRLASNVQRVEHLDSIREAITELAAPRETDEQVPVEPCRTSHRFSAGSVSLLVGNFNAHRTSWCVISVLRGVRQTQASLLSSQAAA